MNEFIEGFGRVDSDYWMGLTNMIDMTSTQRMSLRIEVSNSKEDKKVSEYDLFLIKPREDNFKLVLGEEKFGTLDDKFKLHAGKSFSTRDENNGSQKKNCADTYLGGWWFLSGSSDCSSVCLTCGMGGQWDLKAYFNIKMLIRPYNLN